MIKLAKQHTLDLGECITAGFSDFTFVQGADCQLGMVYSCKGTGGYGKGMGYENYDDATWDDEIRWCNSFVDMVNEMTPPPKFAVICGDLLDAWPVKCREVRKKQYKDFVKVMSRLSVPLVCVCGNHDVGNHPTASTVQGYRSDFGDDWFSFVVNNVFFIVLNSQYFEFGSRVQNITDDQNRWLISQLEVAKSGRYEHSIIFQHIPYFVKQPDEPKIYYTFSEDIRQELLEKFHKAGVTKIFCGHYHRNGGGWYKDRLEVVVTSAIGLQQGRERNGFRIVNVTKDIITHDYVTLRDIDAIT